MPEYDNFKRELGTKNFSQISANLIVNAAKEIGEKITKEDVKNSQLRKFYDTVKNIERLANNKREFDDELKAQLVFLKPHLANAQKKEKLSREFINVLNESIDKVIQGNKKDFEYFVKFFEAIVAYHKN